MHASTDTSILSYVGFSILQEGYRGRSRLYHFNIACEPKAQLYIGSEVPPIPSPLMSRETCDTNYIILHAYSTDEILMCTPLQLVEGQSQG